MKIKIIATLIFVATLSTNLLAGWSVLSQGMSAGSSEISSKAQDVLSSLSSDISDLDSTSVKKLKENNIKKTNLLKEILLSKREELVLYMSIDSSQKKSTILMGENISKELQGKNDGEIKNPSH